MNNRLQYETSPYLLQHKTNPVDWYPWGEEAFNKAKREDKPVFLSIGYSTCHWCHVMAHESFEDETVAQLLNEYFVSVKVDKEERPDIDSVYMSVCQAFTGSGGWPTSIFLTPDQKPFFAGTYFPKNGGYGRIGFVDLLQVIIEKWETERDALLFQAEHIVTQLKRRDHNSGNADLRLTEKAVMIFKDSYDHVYGGFGKAPKFPSPHNLLFILSYYERFRDESCLQMVRHTLHQMYRGGMFDHVGYGFSRYSTDNKWLVPHFEKMLYDNALLIMAYCKAYEVTHYPDYREIAEKTAAYVLREMTSPDGGFYSAQDADSEGEEGKYYIFSPTEIVRVLGQHDGQLFNHTYGITASGNFEGKNIPNLLGHENMNGMSEEILEKLRQYRKTRTKLHLDDKILTAWNGLMIAAMCSLYAITQEKEYLIAAQKANRFVLNELSDANMLYVSAREGKHSGSGFLDDYAAFAYAQLALYRVTGRPDYLERGKTLCRKVISEFKDTVNGGFFLYGAAHEQLIMQPKETYDGAMPSGNSLMAYNLVWLQQITEDAFWAQEAQQQLAFLSGASAHYPAGYSMFLYALLRAEIPAAHVTIAPSKNDSTQHLHPELGMEAVIRIVKDLDAYPLKDERTTYYVCKGQSCLPPVNDLKEVDFDGSNASCN